MEEDWDIASMISPLLQEVAPVMRDQPNANCRMPKAYLLSSDDRSD